MKNLPASVLARLKNRAKELGIVYNDILIRFAEDPNVDPGLCRQAIARTFERRETPVPTSVPEGLSDAFANDDAKLKQWHAFLRKNRLTCDGLTFAELVARLRTFLLPQVKLNVVSKG